MCSLVTQFRAKPSCLALSVRRAMAGFAIMTALSSLSVSSRAYLLTPFVSLSLHPSVFSEHHHFSFFFSKAGPTAVYLRLRSHGQLCRFRVKSGRVNIRAAAWLCTLCNIRISSILCACIFIRREKIFNKRWIKNTK